MSSLGSSSENEEIKFLDKSKEHGDATQMYNDWSWEIKEREVVVEESSQHEDEKLSTPKKDENTTKRQHSEVIITSPIAATQQINDAQLLPTQKMDFEIPNTNNNSIQDLPTQQFELSRPIDFPPDESPPKSRRKRRKISDKNSDSEKELATISYDANEKKEAPKGGDTEPMDDVDFAIPKAPISSENGEPASEKKEEELLTKKNSISNISNSNSLSSKNDLIRKNSEGIQKREELKRRPSVEEILLPTSKRVETEEKPGWQAEQERFYLELKTKREQEKADEELARKLQEEFGSPEPKKNKEQELSDFELALKLSKELEELEKNANKNPKVESKNNNISNSTSSSASPSKSSISSSNTSTSTSSNSNASINNSSTTSSSTSSTAPSTSNTISSTISAIDAEREQEQKDRELALKLAKELEEEEKKANEKKSETSTGEKKKTVVEIEYPNYWISLESSSNKKYVVEEGSTEYSSIADRFLEGLPGATIIKIKRNQNKKLWMWYLLQKNEISGNSKYGANEKFLFHGSRTDAYKAILNEGFDFRLAQLTGAIGAGIYFAEGSGTSSAYVSGNSTKKMLLCRVTLGEVGKGVYGLRRPPEKIHWKGKGSKIYDSVGNGGGVYVIFDNRQAFPEYIISYY